MKPVNWVNIALISLLCLVKFTSMEQTTDYSGCAIKGNQLTVCALLEFSSVFLTIICEVVKADVDSGSSVSCVAESFVPPFNHMIEKSMNGLVEGGYWMLSTCPPVFKVFRSDINSICPALIKNLNNAVLDPVQNTLGITQEAAPKFNPICGEDSSPEVACSIVEFFTIWSMILCVLGKINVNVDTFILCMASLLTSPYDNMIVDILYGLVEGLDKSMQGSCQTTNEILTGYAKTNCPKINSDLIKFINDLLGNNN